jgi:hypothetical protein
VCALGLGEEIAPALFWSALLVFILSIGYVVGDDEGRKLVASPSKAFLFFVGGMLFALFSFAGDCLFGFISAPEVDLLTACTKHAGIGFVFTLFIVAMAIGMPLLGLLRSVVAVLWSRSG